VNFIFCLFFSQVIYAKEISSSVKTFGWSLSAGMDLDENNYPDLLVGAYDSNNAVYLRSAPVVHLQSKANFRVASKQVKKEFAL
jgi:integrin alpha 8